MTRISELNPKLGLLALAACALLLLPAAAGAADEDLVSIEILVDGVHVAVAKTPVYEPVTIQMEPHSPVLGIYPEYVGLRGDTVTLAVYEVDDLREVKTRTLIESVDVSKTGAVALDGAGDLVHRSVEVRLVAVELAVR